MYAEYFGMQEMPFSLAPDTQYFFCHQGHQEALNVLLVALNGGDGFVKIVGEVGTGKTLLCRELLNRLGDDYCTAYIPNPYLSPISLRKALAEELGLDINWTSDHDMVKAINSRLIELNEQGRRVIVCIDEAQAMPDQTLEALRLLSNLETEKSKLLQIVLFGQPELDEKLARQRNRQLRQRIVYSYQLKPLDCGRINSYLEHRLRVAGYNGEPLFSQAAIEKLYAASGGIPRLLNILSNKALLLAFGKGQRLISLADVHTAIEDTEGLELQPVVHEYAFNTTIGVGVLVLLTGLYLIWGYGI